MYICTCIHFAFADRCALSVWVYIVYTIVYIYIYKL